MSETVRISTGPLSGCEQMGIRVAGYIELRNGPDPVMSELLQGPYRVVDVGPDWIDVEKSSV